MWLEDRHREGGEEEGREGLGRARSAGRERGFFGVVEVDRIGWHRMYLVLI